MCLILNTKSDNHRGHRVTRGESYLTPKDVVNWFRRNGVLPHRLFDFRDPVGALQHFAGFGTVGGAYYAVALHEVDEVGGASVAYAQTALQERCGGFAELDHQAHGVVEQRIVLVGGKFSGIAASSGR